MSEKGSISASFTRVGKAIHASFLPSLLRRQTDTDENEKPNSNLITDLKDDNNNKVNDDDNNYGEGYCNESNYNTTITDTSASISTLPSSASVKSPSLSPSRNQIQSTIIRPLITTAGTIVGGAAGLIVAGPTGAYVGSSIGKYACLTGCVVIQGTVRAIPFVLGAAMAAKGTQAISKKNDGETGDCDKGGWRVIGFGGRFGSGVSSNDNNGSVGETIAATNSHNNGKDDGGVMLERRNITFDPEWEKLAVAASKLGGVGVTGVKSFISSSLPLSSFSPGERARRVRGAGRRRDVTGSTLKKEVEILSSEYAMILVATVLNDITSVPGRVYRALMNELMGRYCAREDAQRQSRSINNIVNGNGVEKGDVDGVEDSKIKNNKNIKKIQNNKENDECHYHQRKCNNLANSRGTRDDVHAVLRYVSSSLLSKSSLSLLRPLSSAPSSVVDSSSSHLLQSRSKMGAELPEEEEINSAIESLVFGSGAYDLAFNEIVNEDTRYIDQELMTKISEFQISSSTTSTLSSSSQSLVSSSSPVQRNLESYTSERALEALRSLPEQRSVSGKLEYCVRFLTFVAEMFSKKDSVNGNSKLPGADTLLEMVCIHILVAKVPGLNAEVAFVEEFARDEQLLKGKEGYALITLRASLHFMNASNNFDRDIFYSEDDTSGIK